MCQQALLDGTRAFQTRDRARRRVVGEAVDINLTRGQQGQKANLWRDEGDLRRYETIAGGRQSKLSTAEPRDLFQSNVILGKRSFRADSVFASPENHRPGRQGFPLTAMPWALQKLGHKMVSNLRRKGIVVREQPAKPPTDGACKHGRRSNFSDGALRSRRCFLDGVDSRHARQLSFLWSISIAFRHHRRRTLMDVSGRSPEERWHKHAGGNVDSTHLEC